jgi:DNA-directed RNA polymerase specialized sigma24 family protein
MKFLLYFKKVVEMVIKKTSTDYTLIEMFSDEHEAFAREAFVEFYSRYSSFIYNTCFTFVSDSEYIHDAKSAAADLSQVVIQKVLKGSSRFRQKKDIPIGEIKFHVRGWLYKIIENAFNDEYLKKQLSRPKLVRFEVETQDKVEYDYLIKETGAKTKLSKERRKKYEMIVNSMEEIKMTDKEVDVLRVYLESGWFDENDNWNLPPERMQELTDKYGVQKNSIIQCKGRLMAKLKNALQN